MWLLWRGNYSETCGLNSTKRGIIDTRVSRSAVWELMIICKSFHSSVHMQTLIIVSVNFTLCMSSMLSQCAANNDLVLPLSCPPSTDRMYIGGGSLQLHVARLLYNRYCTPGPSIANGLFHIEFYKS